ncbi:hypothetical protein CIB48_g5382 [Xylaria polymorpha]|nr:hypothetical protein CIB48_g5382 [Xylaria polymorpha]
MLNVGHPWIKVSVPAAAPYLANTSSVKLPAKDMTTNGSVGGTSCKDQLSQNGTVVRLTEYSIHILLLRGMLCNWVLRPKVKLLNVPTESYYDTTTWVARTAIGRTPA